VSSRLLARAKEALVRWNAFARTVSGGRPKPSERRVRRFIVDRESNASSEQMFDMSPRHTRSEDGMRFIPVARAHLRPRLQKVHGFALSEWKADRDLMHFAKQHCPHAFREMWQAKARARGDRDGGQL
jgi:hypothetical protein